MATLQWYWTSWLKAWIKIDVNWYWSICNGNGNFCNDHNCDTRMGIQMKCGVPLCSSIPCGKLRWRIIAARRVCWQEAMIFSTVHCRLCISRSKPRTDTYHTKHLWIHVNLPFGCHSAIICCTIQPVIDLCLETSHCDPTNKHFLRTACIFLDLLDSQSCQSV